MPTSSPDDFDLAALQRAVFGNNGAPSMKAPSFKWRWLLLIPILWLLLTFMRSFVLVGAGERAVLFNRFSGTQPVPLGEGMHFVMPWVIIPTIYDVKSQTYTMALSKSEANPQTSNANDALEALTSDGLPISLDMSVRFRIDPQNVAKLHQEIGPLERDNPDYVSKIVRPQVRSRVRMVIARYPVTAIYGKGRQAIEREINVRLREMFVRDYILLDEALLRNIRFSPDFQQAIEQKQVAQQEVQRMAYVVQQADKERRRKIIEAEGEAESIRLKANALARNPQLVQYEYVKNLPANTRTIITDGRTIVNLGDALAPGTVTAADDTSQPASASSSSTTGADSDATIGEASR